MASDDVTAAFGGAADVATLAQAWLGIRPTRHEPLAGGGFSGAPVFRAHRRSGGDVVLKRVGGSPEAARRTLWVHALIRRGREQGIAELPEPLRTPAGDTLVSDADGGVWEMVPFVDGLAIERPARGDVAVAMEVLARMHEAWRSGVDEAPPDRRQPAEGGVAPSIARRIEQARALHRCPWSLRRSAVATAADALLGDVVAAWDHAIDVFEARGGAAVLRRVAGFEPPRVPVQAVARDIWFDHVLYHRRAAPAIAGVVDLHGAGVDSPATDIARLAGGWWSPALEVGVEEWLADATDRYAARRPLLAAERGLVPWLHAVGVIAALDNWFRWVAEERRSFPDPSRVRGRLGRLLEALPAALDRLADHPGIRV